MSNKSKVKSQKSQRGFTLLESMVAIAIFTVGVSTAVFVITQAISVGSRTRDRIVATHLASEGVEVVRNIRDRNWLAGRSWIQGIDDLTDACVQWDSEYDTISCAAGTNVAYDSGLMYYVQTTAAGPFSRTITTTLIPADTPNPGDPERLKIIASVTCGTNCSISLEEYLYNWK